MEIKFAGVGDAETIHDLMIKAFTEYKHEIAPSSALDETIESISAALKDNEKALIAYQNEYPVGMVRFQLTEKGLYFYRLSVIPENQGQGIGKKILKSLEDYTKNNEIHTLYCKVRLNVPRNIRLYSSLGYTIYHEEVVHKPNGINVKVVSMKKQILAR